MAESFPRVLATDLDGTLLRSDGTVSDRTRRALEAAWATGIITVFVTARPPRWLDDLVDHVGEHGIAICGNGAFVYDVPQRRVVIERAFDPDAVSALVADLRDAVPGIGFAAERSDGMGRDLEDPGTDRPVGKLLAQSAQLEAPEFHRLVMEAVGDRAEIGFSGVHGLAEMTAPGVTKAAGLSMWCNERDITAEQVWACGDMPNDLPMLRWAGRAFAVANAHAEVLAAAHEILVSNDDDAVATVLERLVAP
ncbi:HAD family hydrolase [Aeromicrobium sp. CF3.5]|uniref:HAD family hydrolase n=1 Tax=Aeromicrobium sp. CF3.5 TaxID=3373078 RepID=UPI003EE7DB32